MIIIMHLKKAKNSFSRYPDAAGDDDCFPGQILARAHLRLVVEHNQWYGAGKY